MGILQKLGDGTVQITESFDIRPFGTEDDRRRFKHDVTEAAQTGKATKLVAKIAAMQSAITRNKTFYPAEELRSSLDSWTNPYPCPVIKDHNEWNVDGIVGRINEAYMQPDDGVDTLWFEVVILDPEAQEKVANGTWAQVSIGTRVSSAVCSVCGNDWAKGTWCEHERGSHYLKDENDPSSVTMCYWIMGGIGGREVSFVTTPSAAGAGVRDVKQSESAAPGEDDRTFSPMILAIADSDETVESTLSAIEAYQGSPSSNGEANVTSDKEEGVEKTKTDKVEDLITPSDAVSEGEENVEGAEGTQVDGQGSDEGTEDAPSTEVEGEEPEAPEATAEGEAEPESPASDEGAEAADEAAEGDEEAPEGEAAEGEEVVDPLVARVAELEAEVLSLKAQLYVESGLRDGILTGERDALVEAHVQLTESSLDDLISVMSKRRSNVNVSEELLKHQLGGTKPAGVDDDKNADNKAAESVEVSVQTETGEHVVTLTEDDEPVTVTPKL